MTKISRLGILFVLCSPIAFAEDIPVVDDTPDAACEVLMDHMAIVECLPEGRPFARWFCDFSETKDEYFYVIALRTAPTDEDLAKGFGHSSLVGWFGVARRSTLVVQWDVAWDRMIPLSPAYHASATENGLCNQ